MSQTIVNLTLPIVIAKINDVLNNPPPWARWPSPACPDLQQQLVAYVLRRMPVVYITLESESVEHFYAANCYSYEQHTQIEQLIRQGMQRLLDQPFPNQPESEEQMLADASPAPSSWFG